MRGIFQWRNLLLRKRPLLPFFAVIPCGGRLPTLTLVQLKHAEGEGELLCDGASHLLNQRMPPRLVWGGLPRHTDRERDPLSSGPP